LSIVYNYRTLRHVMTKNWCHFWSWYTAFSYYRQILKTWQGKYDVYSWKKLIWIAKKFAKFHARRLNRNENIPKSFLGGATFLKHPVGGYILHLAFLTLTYSQLYITRT